MRIVGGRHRGRKLRAPAGGGLRPTSDRARESVFNILEHTILGAGFGAGTVADVFAGTGALGLEALSRGASHATFIDNDPVAIKCVRGNAGGLGEGRSVTLLKLDAVRLPPPPLAAKTPCALVFLDPPYESGLGVPALQGLAAKGWIADGTVCVTEVAAKEALVPPPGFALLTERVYGAARVLFLKFQ